MTDLREPAAARMLRLPTGSSSQAIRSLPARLAGGDDLSSSVVAFSVVRTPYRTSLESPRRAARLAGLDPPVAREADEKIRGAESAV